MKILFVANRMPYPPYRGDKLKIYNLACQLAESHELHLLTIAENSDDIKSVEQLFTPINSIENKQGKYSNNRKIFSRVFWIFRPKWYSALNALLGLFTSRPVQVAFFRSWKFKAKLNKVLLENQYDAIHVQHIRMAQYFENNVPSHAILDLPDAFSLYWKRRLEAAKKPWEKWFRRLEYHRLQSYEKRMLPKFKRVLVCSQEDQQYLQSLGINNVDLLSNGVNLDTFSPSKDQNFVRNRILFTGNMDYAPNVDAVYYFVNDILPLIEAEIPAVEFIIAGQRPVKSVLDLAKHNVKVIGFVEDLAAEYAKAHVVVSPLRIGAGTQNKVLEALAMNKAVVCSNVGFKGLGIAHGEGVLMAEDATNFARHTISVLNDDEAMEKLGLMGGEHVRNAFSWTAISKILMGHFTTINQ